MGMDSASVQSIPADNGHCPDCQGGEHHPFHEVTYANLETGEAVFCICPCAKAVERKETPLERGTEVSIIAGKWTGYTGEVLEVTPTESMYIVFLPATGRQVYVPFEWVNPA